MVFALTSSLMQDEAGRKKGYEIDLRAFVGPGQLSLDGEVGGAIVDFYAMANIIAHEGFEAGLENVLVHPDDALSAFEIISIVAEYLGRDLDGLKGDIIRKAIHEVMLDAAGLGYGPKRLNVKTGLERFLRRRGSRKFLELLLSRYVFSTIWIRIQETVRTKAGSGSMTRCMMGLERFCTSIVRSVIDEWEVDGKLEGLPTRRRLGSLLIKTIEARLTEHPACL